MTAARTDAHAEPDLDKLERLEKAATDKGWFVEADEKAACCWVRGRISRKDYVRLSDGTGPIARIDCALEPDAVMFSPMDQEAVANAALIAAARNALPSLLARAREAEDLRRERDEARAEEAHWKDEAEAKGACEAYLERQLADTSERLRKAEERVGALVGAINWACGGGDSDFGDHVPEKAPRYWWRSILTTKAGLEYDREAGLYRLAPAPNGEKNHG